MALEEYDYELPAELLAHTPAEPRDSARLFVYGTKTGEIIFDTFYNLAKYIPKHALLVLNNTKVVPARIAFGREDGRVTDGLVLVNEASEAGTVRALVRRGARLGEVLWLGGHAAGCPVRVVAKPARHCLSLNKDSQAMAGGDEKVFVLALENPEKLEMTLFKFGKTPLPGYIHTPLTEKEARMRYQSVFAENPASVAAPTASLHFTEHVFADLEAKGIERATVTLHVGMGTFAPVTDEHLASGMLHRERYEVGEDAAQNIALAKREGCAVVAVGTTAMRALESAWRNTDGTNVPRAEDRIGETTIFIRRPYAFRIPDMLITNFHLPKSSLMALVDAFLADKNAPHSLTELYRIAIKNNFRFYSFGDAILIK